MRALATRAAAIGALLLPCPLMAQEAVPNIAITHGRLAVSAQPQATMALAILPADHSMAPLVPTVTLGDDIAALGMVKSHSGGGEWADGTFHLAAMCGRSIPAKAAAQSFEYRRFAMMAFGADLTRNLSARDTLTLAASYAAERRRTAFVVGPHRNFRTDERAVALHWTRDDRLDLGATLFDTGPARRRTAAERIADLAGGAPRAVRGWGLTASLYPAGDRDRLSVGIDFRDQQDRDIQHRDARIQIFLKQKF